MKRAIDVAVSALGITVLSPLIIAISAAIAVIMGRPVFFVQERPGLAGHPFKMVKFRTMVKLVSAEGKRETDAERITPLGRFLRNTSLDEIPSLWNVLKGDMSLVGPRPLLMRYLDRYNDFQRRRHEVRPGITGWAQVNGRNAISWEEKFDLDVWYVDNRSLWLDAKILFLTVLKVFRREGISSAGHATMPEFGGSGSDEDLEDTEGGLK